MRYVITETEIAMGDGLRFLLSLYLIPWNVCAYLGQGSGA